MSYRDNHLPKGETFIYLVSAYGGVIPGDDILTHVSRDCSHTLTVQAVGPPWPLILPGNVGIFNNPRRRGTSCSSESAAGVS